MLGVWSIFGVAVASPQDIANYVAQSFRENAPPPGPEADREIAIATQQAMGPDATLADLQIAIAAAQAEYRRVYEQSIRLQTEQWKEPNVGGAPMWVWVGLVGVGLVAAGAVVNR